MRDRRLGYRIPLDLMLTAYVHDRPVRALVLDVSDTGLRIEVVAPRSPAAGTVVQLELALPGVEDTIWASATVCYEHPEQLASGLGVRFIAMAATHARALRDYCVQARHRQLAGMLSKIVGGRSPQLQPA